MIETWSVHFGNPPAVAITSPSAGATFTEPAEITITAEASDSDGSVTQVAFYAGATLIGVDTTSPFTVTWSNVAAGNYTLTAVATDNGGATTTSIPVSIAVYSPSANRPPVLAPIGDKAVAEQTLLSFTASATDPDVPANTLAFSLVGAPPGATIDASTGAFGWMPTEAQGPGTYQFTVRVTDNDSPALAADETITVTVNELNRAPVMAAIGNQSVNEGGTLSFTASATDPDVPANTLAFSLAGAPLGATINSTTGAFSWTPTDAQGPGVYTFTVRVTDNGSSPLSAQESITVTVNEANQAPVLAPIGNQSVIEGGTLTFTGSASDADVPADTLTFSLAGAPNGAAIDPTSGAFSWTPSAAQGPGNYTLTVRVTDNGSPALSDQETITVTVRTAPDFRGPTTSAPRPTVTTVSLSATKPTIPAVRRRSRSLHESPRSD